VNEVVWFKDKYLKERWHCSDMKLWRMRKAGKLNSIQIGGCGPWLTSDAEVRRIEAPPENVKPGPCASTQGTGPVTKGFNTPTDKPIESIPQASRNGGAHG
jgi:hypothetical protein